MKIDRKLNFVIPVYDDKDRPIYVHSAPISKEVFEVYFRVLGKAFNQIFTGGYGTMAGPRIAAMLVKNIAREEDLWDGPQGVKSGLFSEIYRLTNVIVPGGNGWETVPLDEARTKGFVSDDDWAEVENAIVFFSLNSAMLRRTESEPILASAAKLWGAQTTSSNCTEFQASLETSTQAAPTGEKDGPAPANLLSVPS